MHIVCIDLEDPKVYLLGCVYTYIAHTDSPYTVGVAVSAERLPEPDYLEL